MRTTLTLDPDIAARLKALAHQRRVSFKQAVNQVLRRGLDGPSAHDDPPYRVTPHRGGFRPGIDPGRLNQLLDELEVDGFVEEASGR